MRPKKIALKSPSQPPTKTAKKVVTSAVLFSRGGSRVSSFLPQRRKKWQLQLLRCEQQHASVRCILKHNFSFYMVVQQVLHSFKSGNGADFPLAVSKVL